MGEDVINQDSAGRILLDANKNLVEVFKTSKKKYDEVQKMINKDPAMQVALGGQQNNLLETMRKASEAKIKSAKTILDHIGNEKGDNESSGLITLSAEIQEMVKNQIN